MEDLWKTRTAIDFSQRGRLTVDVRIASLAQWGEIQTALAATGNVTGATVTAMTTGYARMNLTYQGGLDQLREALGGAGLVAEQSRRPVDAGPNQATRRAIADGAASAEPAFGACACWRRPSRPG